MRLDILILILWEFSALYFDHIHPSTPLIFALSTFTSLHTALFFHGVQFVLPYFSWGWGLPWSVVRLPRVTSLNKSDSSPRSYQMPTGSQVGVDVSPSPTPTPCPCLNLACLELMLALALCLLSQLSRVNTGSWLSEEVMIWMIL